MVLLIAANLKIMKLKEMEFINGRMKESIMVNGKKIK